MTVLHLGVIELPYLHTPDMEGARKHARKGRKWRKSDIIGGEKSPTTGDVAGWLEDKYHVMEIYYNEHEVQIAEKAIESLGGVIESLNMGAPVTLDAFGPLSQFIMTDFKQFLSKGEIDKVGYPGVPTDAAKKGVNHRLKIKRGKARPSFIDTGLYQSSFITWAD